MARTLKSDLSSGHIHIGNGSSMINPAFPILDMGRFSRTSDFTINPPNVKIDADLKRLAARVSESLRMKTLKHIGDEQDWNLDKVLKLPDGTKDNAKARLARDGRSAVISEVSKAINASSIDYSSKYLLSVEPLYVYTLSYAIYQEEIDDSEGMDDRIVMATERKLKSYFNKLLAKKYIEDRHINLSKEQKKQILQAAATASISYLQGEPVKAINKIVSKYVDYGDLNMLVDKFFEAGTIDPEKGTPQVRQLMVKYLIDIGLTVSSSDLAAAGPSGRGGGGDPLGSAGPGGVGPGGGTAVNPESRKGPSDENVRESDMGKSGGAVEGPLPADAESELKRRITEMDIAPRKEGSSNPGPASGNPKSSKTRK